MRLPTRYIRRRSKSSSHEGNFFKKDSTQDQVFFGEPSHESFFQQTPSSLQRKCDGCEEEQKNLKRKSGADEEKEKKLQMKSDHKDGSEEEKEKRMSGSEKKEEDEKKVQLKTADRKEEEEKKLQKKGIKEEEKEGLHRKEGSTQSASVINTSSYINTLNGKGSALPGNISYFFANRIGYDFSNVKIHTGFEAEASAREVNARAYTYENHIVFNKGEYDPSTYDGKKLLAHELVHTIQQGAADVCKKDKDETAEECTAASVDLEALTTAGFHKKAGTVANEKTKKSKECPDCEDDCVNITGNLLVPFKVDTKINLPQVPANLTPCQQDRVRAAINGPLLKHEKEHVKAFETFNGTASLKINFKGCESDYSSHQETLAEKEFQRRKSLAEAKSDALDPFSVPVDLCCVDKPKKK